jgi:chaperonin GroEL
MQDQTPKVVVLDAQAREKLLIGVSTLADAVKVTMGPRGRNVLIRRPDGTPILTKDGVTVARAVRFKDQMLDMGAQIAREAADRTCDEAGDGTTTSTVLTAALFSEGLKLISAGFSGTDVKNGIDLAVEEVSQNLTKMSRPVESSDDLLRVATISANGEASLGELIRSAIVKVGADGVVAVEEAKGFASSLTVVDGLRISRGFVSPYFVTNSDKMLCELEKPLILMVHRRLDSMKEIAPLLEKVLAANRSLLIISEDVDGDALQGLVTNKVRGILKVCAVRMPGDGASKFEFAEDVATMLGTKVFSAADMERLSASNFSLDTLGNCTKVQVSRTECVIVGSNPDRERSKERAQALRERLESTPDDNERRTMKDRLAALSGGVAVLRVGGATEAELRERRDRVDDALHATQAALRDGVLPGGGVALARAAATLARRPDLNDGQNAGIGLVRTACGSPLKQIVANSGGVPDLVHAKVMELTDSAGYDAYRERFGDMLEMGIIDPTRVSLAALRNAASAAGMLLTIGCALIEESDI